MGKYTHFKALFIIFLTYKKLGSKLFRVRPSNTKCQRNVCLLNWAAKYLHFNAYVTGSFISFVNLSRLTLLRAKQIHLIGIYAGQYPNERIEVWIRAEQSYKPSRWRHNNSSILNLCQNTISEKISVWYRSVRSWKTMKVINPLNNFNHIAITISTMSKLFSPCLDRGDFKALLPMHVLEQNSTHLSHNVSITIS